MEAEEEEEHEKWRRTNVLQNSLQHPRPAPLLARSVSEYVFIISIARQLSWARCWWPALRLPAGVTGGGRSGEEGRDFFTRVMPASSLSQGNGLNLHRRELWMLPPT